MPGANSERNKEVLRQLNDAFTRKDLEGVVTCYAIDGVHHEPFTTPPDFVGPEQIRQYFMDSFRTFPDETVTINKLMADGNWVVGLWTCSGTHAGEFLGIPGTNKRFEVDECGVAEFNEEGKIKNFWVFVDSRNILQQLGYRLIPD